MVLSRAIDFLGVLVLWKHGPDYVEPGYREGYTVETTDGDSYLM